MIPVAVGKALATYEEAVEMSRESGDAYKGLVAKAREELLRVVDGSIQAVHNAAFFEGQQYQLAKFAVKAK